MKIRKNKRVYDNDVFIQGYLYNIPDEKNRGLRKAVTGAASKHPGTEYITGKLEIATDDEMTNIVTVNYSYVTPHFGDTNKVNQSYTVLEKIIDGTYKVAMRDTDIAPTRVQLSTSIGLNEFYIEDQEDHELKLVSQQGLEGGFISTIKTMNPEDQRNSWKVDMVITKVINKEADEEKNLPEKVMVSGYIFNFNDSLMPVTFSATNPGAIDYFMGLDASTNNPTFTQVEGSLISQTIIRNIEKANAFGPPIIVPHKDKVKAWNITWAREEPYVWDDEDTVTAQFMNEKLAERETELAVKKNDYLTRKKEKANAPGAFGSAKSNDTSTASAADINSWRGMM